MSVFSNGKRTLILHGFGTGWGAGHFTKTKQLGHKSLEPKQI